MIFATVLVIYTHPYMVYYISIEVEKKYILMRSYCAFVFHVKNHAKYNELQTLIRAK